MVEKVQGPQVQFVRWKQRHLAKQARVASRTNIDQPSFGKGSLLEPSMRQKGLQKLGDITGDIRPPFPLVRLSGVLEEHFLWTQLLVCVPTWQNTSVKWEIQMST